MSEALSHPAWHEPLWQHMAEAMAADRVAHGLLVVGAPGVGKRAFAQRIVRALLCRERSATGDACGLCAGCRQAIADTHPDISRLVPEEAGRQIKVEQVRAFSHRLHLTPQYDSGRMGWIDPAEQLSISAANSLLKTLEEPPAGCHIVLIADRVSALMATIRSRCQLWWIPPATPETARVWLDDEDLSSEGLDADSLRTPFAVKARQARDYDALADKWDRDLARLLANQADALAVAERAADDPGDLWIDWLYRRSAALLARAAGADNTGLPRALAAAGRRLSPVALERWCAGVGDAARLAHTNADWRLVLESLLLELQSVVRGASA